MKKFSLLYIAFILVIILATLHFIAEAFYLYWTIWWIDNIMHFLGGLSLGFFSLYIFYESKIFKDKFSLPKAIFISFIVVMIISGAWEVFEYINDLTQSTEEYSLDTAHDLISDTLGVTVALLIAKRILKSS